MDKGGIQKTIKQVFLHGNAKQLRVQIQAIFLHLFNWKMPKLVATFTAKAIRICPCSQHEMKCVGITLTTWPKDEHNKDNDVNIRTWRYSIYGKHWLVN